MARCMCVDFDLRLIGETHTRSGVPMPGICAAYGCASESEYANRWVTLTLMLLCIAAVLVVLYGQVRFTMARQFGRPYVASKAWASSVWGPARSAALFAAAQGEYLASWAILLVETLQLCALSLDETKPGWPASAEPLRAVAAWALVRPESWLPLRADVYWATAWAALGLAATPWVLLAAKMVTPRDTSLGVGLRVAGRLLASALVLPIFVALLMPLSCEPYKGAFYVADMCTRSRYRSRGLTSLLQTCKGAVRCYTRGHDTLTAALLSLIVAFLVAAAVEHPAEQFMHLRTTSGSVRWQPALLMYLTVGKLGAAAAFRLFPGSPEWSRGGVAAACVFCAVSSARARACTHVTLAHGRTAGLLMGAWCAAASAFAASTSTVSTLVQTGGKGAPVAKDSPVHVLLLGWGAILVGFVLSILTEVCTSVGRGWQRFDDDGHDAGGRPAAHDSRRYKWEEDSSAHGAGPTAAARRRREAPGTLAAFWNGDWLPGWPEAAAAAEQAESRRAVWPPPGPTGPALGTELNPIANLGGSFALGPGPILTTMPALEPGTEPGRVDDRPEWARGAGGGGAYVA